MREIGKKIGIITKRGSRQAVEVVRDLLPWLQERGEKILLDEEAAQALGTKGSTTEELAGQSEVFIVFGGDGTLLAAARLAEDRNIPILGVNLGGLGFLAEVPLSDIRGVMERALDGRCSIEERVMLRAEVHREGERIPPWSVLNDVVINKGALARIVAIETSVDGQPLNTFHADGLIISTPTGSTAYNLSAGGPILFPTLRSVVLTPICPHILANRPIVLPDSVSITARILSRDDVYLTMDGQVGFTLHPGDVVEVAKSEHTTKLLIPCERDYFEILRTKLKWGTR